MRRQKGGKASREDRAGFCGLDPCSINASIVARLEHLDRADPEAAKVAPARYACLAPLSRELSAAGRASLSRACALCAVRGATGPYSRRSCQRTTEASASGRRSFP
ncbi:erythromycin esterase family protein [Paracoccus salsus]|uniref:erythromycin esterase family protein n=1 Tax=Paracoccus salsus TaxID=2911061 RepID=UPI0034E0CCB6